MQPRRTLPWKLPGVAVWMVAAGLLAVSFTSPAGTAAALAAVAAAFALAFRMEDMPVRLPRLWLVSAASLAAVVLLRHLILSSAAAAKVLGSPVVYGITEFALWFTAVAALLTPLLVSAGRYSSFLSLEAGILVSIFAALFAAHRDGSLHRPFFVTDWLLERNYDPLPFFLACGAMLGILLIVWIYSRRSSKRSLFDPLLLIGLMIALFLFLPDGKVRQLNAWAGSGGNAKDKQQEGGGGSSGNEKQKKQQKQDSGSQNDPDPSNGTGSRSFPVAVVNLHDDYKPPYGTFYFRQDAQSSWNGKRLIRDNSGKLDTDIGIPFPAEPVDVPMRDRADTAVQPGRKRIAHRLRTTVALMTPHSRPISLIDAARFEPAPNPDPKRFERAYRVESIVLDTDFSDLLQRPVGSEKWAPEVWQHYTRMPDDPRYQELAAQAGQQLPPHLRNVTLAQALAIKFWLDKNTTYNLNVPRPMDDQDPVAGFLFGNRNGYCVHLAHSAAYLFRSIGIPARVSVGYAVDGRQRGSGSALLIRNGDAHAWPEIYVRGLGWVVLDITPEKVVTPPQQEKPDPELQRMLGEMARQTPGSPKEENPPAGDGDLRKAFWESLIALGKIAWPLALATLLGLYMMKFWRRLEPRFCAESKLPITAYRAALDRLADLGFHRGFGVSREAFAESLGAGEEMRQLTLLHLRNALGAGPADLGRAEYLEMSRRPAQIVGERVPLWRRILGWLHPLAWWKVS